MAGDFESLINIEENKVENLYIELIKQVEEKGDLSPYGRERLWKAFQEKTDFATAKTKRLELELGSLQKVIDGWKKEVPISKKLQKLYKKVVNAIQEDSQELDQLLSQFYEQCDIKLDDDRNFYEYYLKQSIRYLMYIVRDIPMESLNDITAGNYDIDSDEWDTAFCACFMYAYNKMTVSDNESKRREREFWDWYIREAAKLQGITIQVTMKIPKELLEEKDIVIQAKEDFVKFISYEYDYIKHEITKDKELQIYVFDSKDGAPCPDCGQFSNHVETESGYGYDLMGKLNGWEIEFRVKQNTYYCDNPKCQTEWFFVRNRVLYAAKHAHFAKLKKMSGMPKKICALFEIE